MLKGSMRRSIALMGTIAAWSMLAIGSARAQVRPSGDSIEPADHGGGDIAGPTDRITEAQRTEIQQQIDRNIDTLRGAEPAASPLELPPRLAWPLRAASTFTDYGYHGISNFVDHDPAYPNRLRDYQCGTRSYDTADGYNHAGTDMFLWPFPWLKMDASHIQIVASAPGTVVYKSDGHFDRSCTFNSNDWNAVYVRHADGSVAWYGHMKSGSLTWKPIGAAVAAGEYLGTVGSSGSSTGPHLHFELHDAGGTLLDPYQGACNPLPQGSWWVAQPQYRDSAINTLTTGTAPPSFGTCPNQEVTNARTVFAPGSRIYFTTFYRDQVAGQVSTFRILRPDRSVYTSWTHTSPATYNSSYWYWSFDDVAGPAGLWSFEVTFQGRTYASTFAVGSADSDSDQLPDSWETQFGLNPFTATGDDGAAGDPDHDGRTNLQEYQQGTHPRGFFTRYFAEGATSAFFDTSLALLNLSPTNATSVALRFQKGDGANLLHVVSVGAFARATVNVKDVPGMAAAEFSTVIESDQPVVADRTMTWDASGYGSHAETSVGAPATTWYLAEGATHSGFALFYLIQNPNDADAHVQVKYLLPAGPPITKAYSVQRRSRFNIWVNEDDPRLASTDVSAVITSDLPAIVERAMYRSSTGRLFNAGHESAGVTAPATDWFLAEGATGSFFDEFVLIANPSDTAAQIEATFLLPTGATIVKSYTVAANSRFNIWVDTVDARLADTAVSTIIKSSNGVPIIVERSMWWPGPTSATWAEGHDSAGLTSTGRKWALAEGEVGGPRGTETYILIANRGGADHATVTLRYEDGAFESKTFVLAASSRTNVAVATEFPNSVGKRFGAIIEAASPDAQIAVERAMYSNANGVVWAAGTNAVATRLQ